MAEDNPLIEGAKNLERKFESVTDKIPTLDTVKQAYAKYTGKTSSDSGYKVAGPVGKASSTQKKTTRKRVSGKR